MDQQERLIIVKAIGIVNKALVSLDKDKTQCATLSSLVKEHGTEYDLFFANGGIKIIIVFLRDLFVKKRELD